MAAPWLARLPFDALAQVLADLPARDVASLSMACHDLRDTLLEEELWTLQVERWVARQGSAAGCCAGVLRAQPWARSAGTQRELYTRLHQLTSWPRGLWISTETAQARQVETWRFVFCRPCASDPGPGPRARQSGGDGGFAFYCLARGRRDGGGAAAQGPWPWAGAERQGWSVQRVGTLTWHGRVLASPRSSQARVSAGWRWDAELAGFESMQFKPTCEAGRGLCLGGRQGVGARSRATTAAFRQYQPTPTAVLPRRPRSLAPGSAGLFGAHVLQALQVRDTRPPAGWMLGRGGDLPLLAGRGREAAGMHCRARPDAVLWNAVPAGLGGRGVRDARAGAAAVEHQSQRRRGLGLDRHQDHRGRQRLGRTVSATRASGLKGLKGEQGTRHSTAGSA